MKKYLAVMVVSGMLFLLGSIPCLADAGTGIGVNVEATVVAGDSGSSGYQNWNGGSSHHHYTTTSNTTSTALTGNATAYVAPIQPPVYTPPTYTPPTPEPYIPVEGLPMPTQQGGIGSATILLIIGGICAVGFILWKFVLKRKGS